MNPNKPTRPIVAILKDASSCTELYSSIQANIANLNAMRDRSMKLRDAYEVLRNSKTAITQYGPTRSLMALINHNGELAHAIHVEIPRITNENKAQVVQDVVAGIDNTTSSLMDRLTTYGRHNLETTTELANNYINLAVNHKSVLCDLRRYISAVDYNDQALIADTKLCGCSKESFSIRISALRSLHRALTSEWTDWSRKGLACALDKLGYQLVVDDGEDLDPEAQPEEPLEPEMVVVPKGEVKEGSDTPIPDAATDQPEVAPSVETPAVRSMQDLGWSRKTMLDSINSLIAAVDKTKELTAMNEHLTKATESLDHIPDCVSDYRMREKTVLARRTYFAVCSQVLTIYGRELNGLVNDTINLVVRLHGSLDGKS